MSASKDDRRAQELRLWLAILRVHSLIFPELNRSLRDNAGVGLAKLDVLAQLARTPEGLSMGALSAALKVTNGNTSGLVNRLIKDGLVSKTMSATDRRSYTVTLTAKGQGAFGAAMKSHEATLADLMGDVSTDELSRALEPLRALSAKLKPEGVPDD